MSRGLKGRGRQATYLPLELIERFDKSQIMQDSLRMGKRALSIAVAAATILWSIGFSAFVAPLTARAASSGDVVRGTTLSTLYYYATDGKRYAFPNEKTYMTWYSDFSGVQTLSDSALAAIPLGGNVVYRPGALWVKIQSDPKTYAVTPNGQLRWVESEAVASGLAGSDWNKFINDVPDVFFVDYTVGASLTSAASAYNGALVKASDGTNYLISNGQKRMVTSAGFSGNRFQTRNLLDGTGIVLSGITSGADVTGQEAVLVNTAQTAQVATTGGLTLSLASDSPAAMTIPSSSSNVTMMKFNLSASSGTATVSSIVVKQGGVGGTSNVDSVYLYDGSTRLTDARSVNTSTREATFSGLNLSLSAGQTKTLSVVVDMTGNATGGDTIQYEIAGASSVVGSATVGGAFPVRGATMTASATDVGTLTLTSSGSITNPTLGQKQAVIAEFKLAADSQEAVNLQRVRLDISEATSHSNYNLFQNDVLVAAGTRTASDKVDFVLTKPFTIGQGSNKIFQVKADIGGENGEDLSVAVDEDSDVYAIGAKYGFGVAVTNSTYGTTNCTTASGCSFSDVQGGKITVAFNGPAATKFKPDQTGVVLMDFTVTSQHNVTIRNMQFEMTGLDFSGTAATDYNFQNFRLVNKATGQSVAGPEEFDANPDNSDDPVTFTDDWNMTAGQSIDLQLLVDAKGSTAPYDVAANDTITATLDIESGATDEFQARDSNNDDLVVGTDIIPGTDLTGNAMAAQASALTVAVSQPPTIATSVKGTPNVGMLGLSWTAGPASLAKVSALTLSGSGDDATVSTWSRDVDPRTYISSCSLYDSVTGGLIDGPESFGADAGEVATGTDHNIVFSGFAWTIPAGQTFKMVVNCNFANVAPTSSNSDAFMVELNDEDDVTAVDSDGNSIITNGGVDGAAIDINAIASGATAAGDIYQTLASSGTMAFAVAGDNPTAMLVLGQSTGVTVAKYKITADDESFLVRKLSVNSDQAANLTGVSSVALEYKDQAGATRTASGVLSGRKVTFDGLELYAPKDESITFAVKINTGDVTSDNAASGHLIDLELISDSTNDDEFEAVGLSSGTTLDDDDVDAGGSPAVTGWTDDGATDTLSPGTQTHEMRKTKPTISLASGSPSGNGIPGLGEVLKFNVSADSRGAITWSKISFRLSTTDNNGAGTGTGDWNECDGADGEGDAGNTTSLTQADFKLYDVSDTTTDLIADSDYTNTGPTNQTVELALVVGASCSTDEKVNFVKFNLEADTGTAEEIGAGSTTTYAVWMDTTDASSANDDSVRLDILAESDASGAIIDKAFEWDDSTVATNIDGDLVKNLPLTGGTIVY